MSPQQSDIDFLNRRLHQSKQHFDGVIDAYWNHELRDVSEQFGLASRQTMRALADVMAHGGKRVRATLAEQSYRMFGGQDQRVIDQMGLALEIIHAYLLVVDDVSDQSDLRRGGPAAHRALEVWHQQAHLHDDARHFGESQATLAAMTGAHLAMCLLTELPVDSERRVAALRNLNQLLTITCHGQINDLYNQAAHAQDVSVVEHVLLWKTAYYSFINPLQLGAIVADSPSEALHALEDYGRAAGRAFQISDDITGLFGHSAVTGKSPVDDIREGKRTLLVVYALELANADDAAFLQSQLGNQHVTTANFERCRHIVGASGALARVRHELQKSCEQAKEAIQHDLPDGDSLRFLRCLPDYIKERET